MCVYIYTVCVCVCVLFVCACVRVCTRYYNSLNKEKEVRIARKHVASLRQLSATSQYWPLLAQTHLAKYIYIQTKHPLAYLKDLISTWA